MSSSLEGAWTIALAVALGAAACGGGYDAASDTETTSSDIYLGVDIGASELAASGLVAIYHPKLPDFPNFYPRPCSGVIVRSYGGLTTVLTARHCVTTNGLPDGTLVDGSLLRLSPTLSPGPALPNPPPDAVSGWFVIDKLGTMNDVAVVNVLADWTSIADNRIGLYVGDVHSLVGQGFTAYGYGINVADGNCGTDNNSTGAGVARSGAVFTVNGAFPWANDGQPAEYTYDAPSTGGQAVFCGDSGGPDEMITGAGRLLIGVHSGGATTSGTVDSIPFDFGLQNRLGGLYLVPRNATGDVMLGSDLSTGAIQIVARGSALQTVVSYDSSTKLLNMNGGCVSAVTGFPSAPVGRVVWCNAADPTQLWTVRVNGQLYNPRTGRCLNNGSTGVTLAACTITLPGGRPFVSSSTLWSFHGQP